MPAGVFTIARGRAIELYTRVRASDPPGGAFLLILLQGTVTDDVLRRAASIATVKAISGITESAFIGYARPIVRAADLLALPAPDFDADTRSAPFPTQSFRPQGGGGNITRPVVAYTPNASNANGGPDASIIPLTFGHILGQGFAAVTPFDVDFTTTGGWYTVGAIT